MTLTSKSKIKQFRILVNCFSSVSPIAITDADHLLLCDFDTLMYLYFFED